MEKKRLHQCNFLRNVNKRECENKIFYLRYSSCFVEKQDFLGERHCPEDQRYNASKGSVLQAAAPDTGSRFYVIKESEKNSTVLTVNYEFRNSCNIL